MITSALIKPKEVSFSAVVIRCRCNNPTSHRNQVCPKGKKEDLGIISYWNKNPLKRLSYWISRHIRFGDYNESNV